jgi:hypothetical protein
MKELFVGQQEAFFAEASLALLSMPHARPGNAARACSRQLGVETLNQTRHRSCPTLILLAGQGAYAGSSLTVVVR